MKTMNPINHTRITSVFARVAILLISIAFLAGCGKKLSGTYMGDGGMYTQLKFTSGKKVELTITGGGSIMEATYAVEGDSLKINMGGQTQIFTMDKDGCFDGGDNIGKFCKK